jgi:hypothetical protein
VLQPPAARLGNRHGGRPAERLGSFPGGRQLNAIPLGRVPLGNFDLGTQISLTDSELGSSRHHSLAFHAGTPTYRFVPVPLVRSMPRTPSVRSALRLESASGRVDSQFFSFALRDTGGKGRLEKPGPVRDGARAVGGTLGGTAADASARSPWGRAPPEAQREGSFRASRDPVVRVGRVPARAREPGRRSVGSWGGPPA